MVSWFRTAWTMISEWQEKEKTVVGTWGYRAIKYASLPIQVAEDQLEVIRN